MPNRIIKESICTSENIERLTPFQETVFVRLIVNCDDFGRFDARPKLLSSRLFPLRDVSVPEMEEAIKALQLAGLITVYVVDDHPYLFMNKWLNHQQKRSDKSKYPDPDSGTLNQPISNDSTCNQPISDETKSHRNRDRDRSTENDNRDRNPLMDDEEAHAIQNDHNRILDAAVDAGFKCSNSENAGLLRLYADYGLDKMLEALESCVKHGASNLAYLEAVLKGNGKKPTKRALPAQDFQQRDYSGVDDQQMESLKREMEAFKARGSA